MSSPGTFRFGQVAVTPSPPPAGYDLIYVKTDDVLYIQDSSGIEVPLGTASSITSLTGEVTAVGPGAAVATVSNAAVIGKVLTGFSAGPNSTILSTDTILQAFQKAQAQINAGSGSNITSLTGDVSATGPGAAAATVNSVGGKSASAIATSVSDTQAATASNTPSTIVKRDSSGNFAAGTITANLTGAASANVLKTGDSMSGDLNMTGNAIVNVESPVNPDDAATKSYVDNLAVGIIPQNPVLTPDLINDTLNTPPVSPVFANSYIIGPSPTGAWATIGAGHLTCWDGSIWRDCLGRAVQVNDRFGVNFEHLVTPGGGLTGKQDYIVQIATNTPGFITYTDFPPMYRWTTSDNNQFSLAFGDTYYYDSTNWIEISTGFVPEAGDAISITGVLIDVLFDGTTININGSNQLEIVPLGVGTSQLTDNGVTNAKLAQMPSNTLKGNNTGGTANAVDLTVSQVVSMASSVVVTQFPDQANATGTAPFFSRADHIHNIPSAVPVQIGTTNMQGSAPSFALSDHIHAHGNQTVGTLHAAATTSVNGFMSSTDKSKLDTISATAATNAQILISDGTTYNPRTVSGDATITNAGVVAVNSVTGTIPVNKGGTGATTAPVARVNLNIDERSTFSNANYTVLNTDRYVAQVGTMSAPRVVTLPLANTLNAGQILIIADESGTVSTTNLLTITASGGDTINGSASKTIRSAYGEAFLVSNGSNAWFRPVVGIGSGGTGLSTVPTDGQLLIGSSTSSNYVQSTLTAGTGISITNASGSITVAGNSIFPQVTKTANYTILSTDSIIFVDTSGGGFTLTLPSPAALAGKVYRIIDTTGNLNTNNLTLARSSTEKIEGLAASKVFQTNWGGWQVTTNGTDWFVF